jgi:hypothetical protein
MSRGPLSIAWNPARIEDQQTGYSHKKLDISGLKNWASLVMPSTMLTVSNHLLQALHRDRDVVTNTGVSSFWKASFHWSDHPYSSRFKENPKIMYPMRRRQEVEFNFLLRHGVEA